MVPAAIIYMWDRLWDILHHYDIPDAPLALTDEEKEEIAQLVRYYADLFDDSTVDSSDYG